MLGWLTKLLWDKPDTWHPVDQEPMPVGWSMADDEIEVSRGDYIKHWITGCGGYFKLTARRQGTFAGICIEPSGEITQVYEEEGGFRKLLEG